MAQHMARSRRTAVILLPARLTTSTMVGGRRERWEDRGLGYGDRESVRRGRATREERGGGPELGGVGAGAGGGTRWRSGGSAPSSWSWRRRRGVLETPPRFWAAGSSRS